MPKIPSSPAAVFVQATVPRYRLAAPYANTVHGAVYRGVDVETNAAVFVKIIPKSKRLPFGGASWEALRAETNRLARFDHPHIATLLEVVDAPSATVVVTTTPAGSTLFRLVANDLRPDRRTVVRWGIEILELLAEAHAVDVVHRYLSEHAVLIDAQAKVVLRGFSLTDCSARERLLLSPEQVLGGDVGPRTDIYSVGLLLGRVLQRGDLESSLPNDDPLRAALLRAVAQDPEARYEDVFAMVSALRAAAEVTPTLRPSDRSTVVMAPVDQALVADAPTLHVHSPATVLPVAEIAPGCGVVATASSAVRGPRLWLVAAGAAASLLLGIGLVRFSARDVSASARLIAEAPDQDGARAMPNKPKFMPEKPKTMPEKPKTMAVDPQVTARALMAGGLVGNLFRHADLPENDAELLADLVADIRALDFADDPRGGESVDSLFGVNPLLGDGNPVLSKEAREYWLSLGIEEYGTEAAVAHLEEQHHHIDAGEQDRAGWYEHILACERLCGMVVVGLLYEHIRRVEASPHELLQFATNDADLDDSSRSKVADLVARSKAGDHILLVGRGSRSGDRAYNLALSQRRVESVHDVLKAVAVDDGRIHRFALGYEPPQLTPSLLRRYGFEGALEEVNQSVLVVAYSPEMVSPVGGGR